LDPRKDPQEIEKKVGGSMWGNEDQGMEKN